MSSCDGTLEKWRGWVCPVCGFDGLTKRPFAHFDITLHTPEVQPPYEPIYGTASYESCPCCNFEFGSDDNPGTAAGDAFETFRERWIAGGARWFAPRLKPAGWNLAEQLGQLPG